MVNRILFDSQDSGGGSEKWPVTPGFTSGDRNVSDPLNPLNKIV